MNKHPDSPRALSVAEAARVIGIDQRTLRRAIASGEVPGTRVRHKVLVPVSWIESVIAAPIA